MGLISHLVLASTLQLISHLALASRCFGIVFGYSRIIKSRLLTVKASQKCWLQNSEIAWPGELKDGVFRRKDLASRYAIYTFSSDHALAARHNITGFRHSKHYEVDGWLFLDASIARWMAGFFLMPGWLALSWCHGWRKELQSVGCLLSGWCFCVFVYVYVYSMLFTLANRIWARSPW